MPSHRSAAQTTVLSDRAVRSLNVAAIYGSLVVIAAIVFGTLSVHPF